MYVDAIRLAQEYQFNLDIPDEHTTPINALRMKRKSFNMVCQLIEYIESANKQNQDILHYIQEEFHGRLQYACVSSIYDHSSFISNSFIQIILNKSMHKKGYFFRPLTGTYFYENDCNLIVLFQNHCSIIGMRCNYKVTNNDRAWNRFLKKSIMINVHKDHIVKKTCFI